MSQIKVYDDIHSDLGWLLLESTHPDSILRFQIVYKLCSNRLQIVFHVVCMKPHHNCCVGVLMRWVSNAMSVSWD